VTAVIDPVRLAFESWARPRGVCLDRVRGSDVYLDSRAQELWTVYLLGVETNRGAPHPMETA
jgi:hypothetical protein